MAGVAIAVATVSAAGAQTVDKKVLSLDAAKTIAGADEASAREKGVGVVIAGVPIRLDGKVIGAVGVSGDTPQVDEAIAIAGVAAFK